MIRHLALALAIAASATVPTSPVSASADPVPQVVPAVGEAPMVVCRSIAGRAWTDAVTAEIESLAGRRGVTCRPHVTFPPDRRFYACVDSIYPDTTLTSCKRIGRTFG